jgi:DNA-binding GntR family transcriptional regulator
VLRSPSSLVDPDGVEPLYLQVSRAIAADISAGRLRPGARLPSERRLCANLGISRVTARRALRELVEEGLVEASAGRGWFVASGPVGEPPNRLVSFSAMGRSRGLEPSARVLAAGVRPATLDEADDLEIAPGAELFELERLRLLDGLPVAVDRSRVATGRCPGLLELDFATASLYESVEACGIVATNADISIEAAPAGARHARLLDVERGAPLLVATQVTYDQERRPFELGHIVYRGDRYRFRARLSRWP